MRTNFLENEQVRKIAVTAIIVIVSYYILINLRTKIKQQKNDLQSIVNESQIQDAINRNTTISRARAAQIADQIKGAWGLINDDENAIYNAIRQLQNDADVLLLITVYDYKGENLQVSFTKRLNNRERSKINDILKTKGISITF